MRASATMVIETKGRERRSTARPGDSQTDLLSFERVDAQQTLVADSCSARRLLPRCSIPDIEEERFDPLADIQVLLKQDAVEALRFPQVENQLVGRGFWSRLPVGARISIDGTVLRVDCRVRIDTDCSDGFDVVVFLEFADRVLRIDHCPDLVVAGRKFLAIDFGDALDSFIDGERRNG